MSLLDQILPFLWAIPSTNIGRIQSAPPIKIQREPSKLLPKTNQCSISKEALQGIKPLIEGYKTQGLIIPSTSPCNTPILPVRKPKCGGCKFVLSSPSKNNIIIADTVVPNSHAINIHPS